MQSFYIKPDNSYSEIFKVIVVGDAGVGKTSFVKKLATGKLPQDPKPTVGVDFLTNSFRISNGSKIKVQIWDTAGSEKYKAVTSTHYRKSNGAVVMFDLTSRKSFENSKNWIERVRQLCQPNVVIILIGNKNDLADRQISMTQIEGFVEKQHVLYDEISTKQSKLTKSFQILLQQINRVNQQKQVQKSIMLSRRNEQQTTSSCSC